METQDPGWHVRRGAVGGAGRARGAYVAEDKAYVALEARSMLLGALAFIAYSFACVFVTKKQRVPVWAGALMSWGVWLLAAALLAGTSLMLGARS